MRVIGIDLGTTNSVICEYRRGDTEVLPIEGNKTLPSVVYIKDGSKQVGKQAKSRLMINPENCLSSTKRYIGSSWTKSIEGTSYTPVDAAENILRFLKEQAGGEIKDAVITIPAYFEEEQRKQTMEAAERAGFNVLLLLPEPTAAAIRYGFNQEKDQSLLVIDLGGGTFDVSLLEVKNNDFTVKAVDGDHMLGGDDIDNAIVDFMLKHVETEYGADTVERVKGEGAAIQKLKEKAEEVKIALASSKREEILVPEVISGITVEIPEFTRSQLKELIEPILTKIIDKTQSVLEAASLSIDDINRVVLVGGSCKHPIVQDTIKENFKTPFISPDMDTAVAEGAAIACGHYMAVTTESTKITNVISHSIGIIFHNEEKGFGENKLYLMHMLKKNTEYPQRAAVLGFPVRLEQEYVSLTACRGEDLNPELDTPLGSVSVPLPEEKIGKELTPIAVILELDKDGILTITGVQMPITHSNKSDIEILTKHSSEHNELPLDKLDEFIVKHDFLTKKLKLENSMTTGI